MSDFGDATPEDSYDPTAPADPVAAARLLFQALRQVTGDNTRPTYDQLNEYERVAYAYALAALLDRLRREGSLVP